jgi:hypothetical protein
MSNKNLKHLIEEYKKGDGEICSSNELDKELKEFDPSEDFNDVLRRAGMAEKKNGKRFNHQRRITNSSLVKLTKTLKMNSKIIQQIKSFDVLYSFIKELKIEGIGKLTIYDTSLRIAHNLSYKPKDVYIHAGVSIGLRRLNVVTKVLEKISIKELPEEFSDLKPYHAENFLCIYKDRF